MESGNAVPVNTRRHNAQRYAIQPAPQDTQGELQSTETPTIGGVGPTGLYTPE